MPSSGFAAKMIYSRLPRNFLIDRRASKKYVRLAAVVKLVAAIKIDLKVG